MDEPTAQYSFSPGEGFIWWDYEECADVADGQQVYRRTVTYGPWEPVDG